MIILLPARVQENRLFNSPDDPHAQLKQEAAEFAVRFVESGMIVGLGTGSTAIFATRKISALLRDGSLKYISGFATSQATQSEAQQLGIPMIDTSLPLKIDLTIDGADEVDPQFNLIKGGGGALFREKIVAQASDREIIIVDESKLSKSLGALHVLPVEVSPFGWRSQWRYLESLGARPVIRKNPDGSEYVTDSGNMILDCDFGPIPDPANLAAKLGARAGIIEHGLFIGLTSDLIVAAADGVRHLRATSR
jgi:ribose 5-phosphate isomerase A